MGQAVGGDRQLVDALGHRTGHDEGQEDGHEDDDAGEEHEQLRGPHRIGSTAADVRGELVDEGVADLHELRVVAEQVRGDVGHVLRGAARRQAQVAGIGGALPRVEHLSERVSGAHAVVGPVPERAGALTRDRTEDGVVDRLLLDEPEHGCLGAFDRAEGAGVRGARAVAVLRRAGALGGPAALCDDAQRQVAHGHRRVAEVEVGTKLFEREHDLGGRGHPGERLDVADVGVLVVGGLEVGDLVGPVLPAEAAGADLGALGLQRLVRVLRRGEGKAGRGVRGELQPRRSP